MAQQDLPAFPENILNLWVAVATDPLRDTGIGACLLDQSGNILAERSCSIVARTQDAAHRIALVLLLENIPAEHPLVIWCGQEGVVALTAKKSGPEDMLAEILRIKFAWFPQVVLGAANLMLPRAEDLARAALGEAISPPALPWVFKPKLPLPWETP